MSKSNLYANRNSHGDFITNAFKNMTNKPCGVYGAVAFFTDADTVNEITSKDCNIKLIVRLGYPTSPNALEQVINNSKVQLRYVTSSTFHPKLFIFGEEGALVGSANLTRNALTVNQEVAVLIQRSDERFDDLVSLFYLYWNQGKVITDEVVQKYKFIFNRMDTSEEDRFENEIEKEIGKVRIDNITLSKDKRTKQDIFTDDYQRSYQEFLSSFEVLQDIYVSLDKRKVPESDLPIRLEIDSFISWVRDQKAVGDDWKKTPIVTGVKQKAFVKPLIEEWFESEHSWLTENIAPIRYPLIRDTFKTKNSIQNCTDDELWEALIVCHSFSEQFRHVKGGRVIPPKIKSFEK